MLIWGSGSGPTFVKDKSLRFNVIGWQLVSYKDVETNRPAQRRGDISKSPALKGLGLQALGFTWGFRQVPGFPSRILVSGAYGLEARIMTPRVMSGKWSWESWMCFLPVVPSQEALNLKPKGRA